MQNQRHPPDLYLGRSAPYATQIPPGKPESSSKKPIAFHDADADSKRFVKPLTHGLQPTSSSFEGPPVNSDQQHIKFAHQTHQMPPGPNPASFYPYPMRNPSADGSFPASAFPPYPATSYPPPPPPSQEHQSMNHGASAPFYHVPYPQHRVPQADSNTRVGFPAQQVDAGVQPLPTINQKYPGAHFSSTSSLNENPKFINNTKHSPPNILAPVATDPSAARRSTFNVKDEKKKVSKVSSMSTRKRALTACDTCRFKKIRCDNNRPKCGSCLKSGNESCHYKIDDIREFLSSEVADAILGKLDYVLKEIKDIKTPQLPTYKFDNCVWDMSPESVLKWRYLRQNLQIDSLPVKELLQSYERSNLRGPQNSFTMNKKLQLFDLADKFLVKNCVSLLNSFFILIKFPVFDMIEMYQCVEFCRVVFKIPDASFVGLLENIKADAPIGDCAPESLKDSMQQLEVKGVERFLQFYGKFCSRIPILIVACSIAVLTSPVQLDNIAKYNNSMEERSSDIRNGSLIGGHFEVPDGLPLEKITVLKLLVDYAQFLNTQFTKESNKLDSCIFNILMNQFHLSTMNIMGAYNHIVNAGQDIMYHLEISRADPNRPDVPSEDSDLENTESVDSGIADRLYWICYKLESEMRVELSPHVPLSGITTFPPPRTFPKLPSLLYSDIPEIEVWFDESGQTSLKELTKLEEQNVWYYFLTETAVRKVDNKMFDELYSHDDVSTNKWDSPAFVETGVWTSFIKFQNRYNAIINSMSPNIRNFVLHETDAQKVYKAMRGMKLKNKKTDDESTDTEGLLENLFRDIGENAFNDDSLTFCQSESIMFIKTRILTSKLLLFRPIIYLFLHDLLPLDELIMAALEVMEQQYSQQKPVAMGMSPDSLSSFEGSSDGKSAAHVYQKLHPDEDFTDLVLELNDDDSSDTVPEIVVNDVARARFRVLKVFFQLMLTLQNLNIARLGAHRHAGLWYFVRNVFLGHFIEFLLYKKLADLANTLAEREIETLENIIPNSEKSLSIESVQHLLNSLLPKERIKGNLEFCQLILEYWADESHDCEEFKGLVQRCLDNL